MPRFSRSRLLLFLFLKQRFHFKSSQAQFNHLFSRWLMLLNLSNLHCSFVHTGILLHATSNLITERVCSRRIQLQNGFSNEFSLSNFLSKWTQGSHDQLLFCLLNRINEFHTQCVYHLLIENSFSEINALPSRSFRKYSGSNRLWLIEFPRFSQRREIRH